jgi:GGDEF domain-containing protein
MKFLKHRDDEGRNDYDLAEVQAIAAQGRRLAIYDPATGLFAYWYLQLRAAEELSRGKRHRRGLICLSLWAPTPPAIDELCSALKTGLRDHDLAAYLNNGHFVALLTETDYAGASLVMERLFASCPGASGGIASYPDDGESFDELLEAAKARGGKADAA